VRDLHTRRKDRHAHTRKHESRPGGSTGAHARSSRVRDVPAPPRAGSTRVRAGSSCARENSDARNSLNGNVGMTSSHALVQGRTIGVQRRMARVQIGTTCRRGRKTCVQGHPGRARGHAGGREEASRPLARSSSTPAGSSDGCAHDDSTLDLAGQPLLVVIRRAAPKCHSPRRGRRRITLAAREFAGRH
jgi:hypothetical protein